MQYLIANIYGMLFFMFCFPFSLFLFLHEFFITVEPSLHLHPVVGPTAEANQKSEGEDEEPSQLSLADRVRLFNQKIEGDSRVPAVVKQPAPSRKRLAQTARYKTQPVTTEEVETAARRVSPLAASLAKPPDATVLGATDMSCMPLGHPSAIYQSSQCKSPQVRFVGLV
jgi:hypothetical protein